MRMVTHISILIRATRGTTKKISPTRAPRTGSTDVSVGQGFARIASRTVGSICERVVADQLDQTRFEGLVNIGVDEISWRKHHRYLTLVWDHATSKIVWGAPGKNGATLDGFFKEIGPLNTAVIEAVSMDMGPAFAKSVRANARTRSSFSIHSIQVATNAELPDQDTARTFQGTRWVLLKNTQDLTENQHLTLAGLERTGRLLWDAYQLKESLRELFSGDLHPDDVMEMITTWCELAPASGVKEFTMAAAAIRSHTQRCLRSRHKEAFQRPT